jgi:hypothetical protein
MTEIVPANTMSAKIEYAKALAHSNLLPKQYQQQPANLLYALEYADALGVSPINAITSIHVIEGKPSASADLIAAMIRRAGHKLRVSGNDQSARAVLIRADDPEFEYVAEWTMDKARAAGVTNKSVWKNYPSAMLRSRAITEVARMGASDALFGVVYTPEELGAEVSHDGQPTKPTPVPSQRVTAAEIAAKRAAAGDPTDAAPRDVVPPSVQQATPVVEDPPAEGDGWPETATIPGTES